ncbi:winged helix-turn-helix domain-containing protein [Pseudoalteromonas sp. MMG013]|uniref:winged helix-turn-helix domain-containing protein n=1 Tax=Pseudoalteromonas sp. MMG013 TaxID=2822687 RepID=UPI001B35C8A4|nr:winged helix-turn-helix domain-containing protein [Pseudoalteromonas sp. MMG013]MBQ4861270.1 winged helix-turn-helix domain-containing protein [Pseudoalteromonas sp. MMG013]
MSEVSTFHIAGFEINLTRSTIVNHQCQTHIEPKVLKVLLLLAQRQNEVVTHQEIMAHVWAGTEVVPNALQRCIAILRKELGDNAKEQKIIATHPKIGYRLIADVTWHAPNKPAAQNNESAQVTSLKKPVLYPLFSLVLILVVTLLTMSYWPKETASAFQTVSVLTHTDAHESHAIFNPDANYLIFNRYAGACKSHLWAKHHTTGEETQLTKHAGYYGATSFTPDGRELVFSAKTDCNNTPSKTETNNANNACWSIATLDFAQALSAPVAPQQRFLCQANNLKKPLALSNHNYVFLHSHAGKYSLMRYNDLNKSIQVMYEHKQDVIYHFDYDTRHQRYAIISRSPQLNTYLTLLDKNAKLLSKNPIKLPNNVSKYTNVLANFDAQGNALLTILNGHLYTLEINGHLTAQKTPLSNFVSVEQHPNGHSLIAVVGNKDIDIAQLNSSTTNTQRYESQLNSQSLPFTSLARTSAQERNATYQPHGDNIAFISDRNGHDQLWLWQNSQVTQVSSHTARHRIHNYSWSPEGKRMAWVSNDQLMISDLKGNISTVNTDKLLYSALTWYTDNHILVLLHDPVQNGLYDLNLSTNTLTALNIHHVENAWVNQEQLIYSTLNGRVFSRVFNEINAPSQHLTALNGKAMFLHNQQLYSVNPTTKTLNQYNLTGQRLKTVMQLKDTAWKVTDLKDNKLLLSQFIAINQEVVLLE